MKNLKNIEKLTDAFASLPGIGKKTAERLAYSLVEMKSEDVNTFAETLTTAKKEIKHCPICGLYTEDEICDICNDKTRDQSKIIVVAYPKDAYAFEKLETYNGLYHVLGGVFSAIKGVGMSDLNIDSLIKRVNQGKIKEVIIATNPTIEGETTALYVHKLLENKNVNVSRLAYGLPAGGSLEYADALTLSKALEGRKKL